MVILGLSPFQDVAILHFDSDDTIEGLNIGNPILIDKLCGYADDIVFIIKDTPRQMKAQANTTREQSN